MKDVHSKISIIIVNWNGKKWLKKCLDSLMCQTYKNFEIIFVDNASKDDSVDFVNKNYPNIKIVLAESNLGFAGGNNLGFNYCVGDYIYLLNNDTECDKDAVKNLASFLDRNPKVGSVQSKLILLNDHKKLDVCGSYWTSSTFLYHYGFAKPEDLKKYNEAMPFFSNKGASMMIRKDIIDKIGFFDEDFWCYYEETDLCNRIWSFGYECWYEPKALVYHAVGGTSVTCRNSYIQFHNFKNKLLSFLKNYEFFTLIKVVPIYLFLNSALAFYWLLQGKVGHFFAFYRAIFWNIFNFINTMKKRKSIQHFRRRTDRVLFSLVQRNPRFSYYKFLLVGLEKYED